MYNKHQELLDSVFNKYNIWKKVKILNEKTFNDEELLKRVSLLTEWMSWRDIKKVIDLALNKSILEEKEITYQTIWESLEEWIMWKEKTTTMTETDLKRIAYHELWHAIIWKHFWKHIHQISIATKNMSLWQTFSTSWSEEILPEKESFIKNVYELLWWRAAEKIFIWNISAGSQNDYERATTDLIRYLLLDFQYVVNKNNLKLIAKELWDTSIENMNCNIKLWIVTSNFAQLPDFMKDKIYKYVSIIIADCEIEVEKLLKKYLYAFNYYWPILMKNKTIFEDDFSLDKKDIEKFKEKNK